MLFFQGFFNTVALRAECPLRSLSIPLGTVSGMAIQGGCDASQFGVSERSPTGLAAINSTLYMLEVSNDALFVLRTPLSIEL